MIFWAYYSPYGNIWPRTTTVICQNKSQKQDTLGKWLSRLTRNQFLSGAQVQILQVSILLLLILIYFFKFLFCLKQKKEVSIAGNRTQGIASKERSVTDYTTMEFFMRKFAIFRRGRNGPELIKIRD